MIKFLDCCIRDRKEYILNIYGHGRQKSAIKSWIKENKCKNIIYCGAREREEMENLLQEYEIMLMPLTNIWPISQTIPSKLQTYMAAGKPIIHFGRGYVGTLIKENNIGLSIDLMEQNSKKDLKKFLEDFEINKKIYEANVNEYFEKEFEISGVADKLIKVIWDK